MSTKCWWNVATFWVCHWFLKEKVSWHNNQDWRVHLCGAYQRENSFCIFSFFVAFLNSLGQEEYIASKKEKRMLGSTIVALKFSTFHDFLEMLTKCCLLCDVWFNFPLSQTTIPTKMMSVVKILADNILSSTGNYFES